MKRRWGKIVFFILIGGAVAVGGAELLRRHLAKRGAAIKASVAASTGERSEQDCLDTALGKLSPCTENLEGSLCRAEAGLFLTECLAKATSSSGFCAGVPPAPVVGEIDIEEAKTNPPAWAVWRIERCRALGKNPIYCQSFFDDLQKHCDKKAAAAPADSSAPGRRAASAGAYPDPIEARVRGLIADYVKQPPEQVAGNASLASLGLDELDASEMLMIVEEKFNVDIYNDDIQKVVGASTLGELPDKLTCVVISKLVRIAQDRRGPGANR